MKAICSLAAAALIGISASAYADEPVRLDDAALDSVNAGFLGLAFTRDAFLVFGSSGNFFEQSSVQGTQTPGSTQVRATATLNLRAEGPGPVFSGGLAGAFFSNTATQLPNET